MIKERGIPFSAEMVCAILDDRKTQTRRTVKLPRWTDRVTVDKGGTIFGPGPYLKVHRAEPVPDDVGAMERVHCPYGYHGDRLWVREAWRSAKSLDADDAKSMAKQAQAAGYGTPWAPTIYLADGARRDWGAWDAEGRYRHARFMPRWASRITLEITDVRAQRLHDITQDDAEAEGITCTTAPPIPTYAHLWNRINGADSWGANPWVWAITFKRIDARAS